ncbi:MAG: hypothetical protein H6Q79_3082 [Deltaproteobacteria bacterium]|nr:hypothetical protein [Deltaproteobacteria bacterium]
MTASASAKRSWRSSSSARKLLRDPHPGSRCRLAGALLFRHRGRRFLHLLPLGRTPLRHPVRRGDRRRTGGRGKGTRGILACPGTRSSLAVGGSLKRRRRGCADGRRCGRAIPRRLPVPCRKGSIGRAVPLLARHGGNPFPGGGRWRDGSRHRGALRLFRRAGFGLRFGRALSCRIRRRRFARRWGGDRGRGAGIHPAVPDDHHDQRRGGHGGDEIAELLPHPAAFRPQDRYLRAVGFPLDAIHHARVEPFPVRGSRVGHAGRPIDARQVGQHRGAIRAAAQMLLHAGAPGGGQLPVVEGGQQRLRFPALHHEPPPDLVQRLANNRAFERRCIRSSCVPLLAPYFNSTPQSRALLEAAHRRSRCSAYLRDATPPSAASSRVRARERRDITVPAGIPAARAISP